MEEMTNRACALVCRIRMALFQEKKMSLKFCYERVIL